MSGRGSRGGRGGRDGWLVLVVGVVGVVWVFETKRRTAAKSAAVVIAYQTGEKYECKKAFRSAVY